MSMGTYSFKYPVNYFQPKIVTMTTGPEGNALIILKLDGGMLKKHGISIGAPLSIQMASTMTELKKKVSTGFHGQNSKV